MYTWLLILQQDIVMLYAIASWSTTTNNQFKKCKAAWVYCKCIMGNGCDHVGERESQTAEWIQLMLAHHKILHVNNNHMYLTAQGRDHNNLPAQSYTRWMIFDPPLYDDGVEIGWKENRNTRKEKINIIFAVSKKKAFFGRAETFSHAFQKLLSDIQVIA